MEQPFREITLWAYGFTSLKVFRLLVLLLVLFVKLIPFWVFFGFKYKKKKKKKTKTQEQKKRKQKKK